MALTSTDRVLAIVYVTAYGVVCNIPRKLGNCGGCYAAVRVLHSIHQWANQLSSRVDEMEKKLHEKHWH